MPTYNDTILCEDVRPELNNKLMFAGVFGEEIIVPQIPTAMQSLCLVQRWRATNEELDKGLGEFSFAIEWPNGERQVLPTAAKEPPKKGVFGASLAFVFKFEGFPVKGRGEYKFRTMIDNVESNVYSFYIVAAADYAVAAQPKPAIGFR